MVLTWFFIFVGRLLPAQMHKSIQLNTEPPAPLPIITNLSIADKRTSYCHRSNPWYHSNNTSIIICPASYRFDMSQDANSADAGSDHPSECPTCHQAINNSQDSDNLTQSSSTPKCQKGGMLDLSQRKKLQSSDDKPAWNSQSSRFVGICNYYSSSQFIKVIHW